MTEETVTVRVAHVARGLELGRFMVPASAQADIIVEQGPSQVVLYIPGVDLPVVFIGSVRITIERRRVG